MPNKDFQQIAALTDEFRAVSGQIARLQVRHHEIKQKVRQLVHIGSQEIGSNRVTKYKVRETTVKKHKRRGWIAVRVS